MDKIKIDLGQLCVALDDHDGDWYLDLRTGEVFPVLEEGIGDDPEMSPARIEEDEERYCYIESLGSREGFLIMESFVEEVEEGEASRALVRALRMRGPFRAFNTNSQK